MNKIHKTIKLSKGLIINILILFLIGFFTRFFIFHLNNSNLFIELISFILIGFSLSIDIFINYTFELFSNFKNMYMHILNSDIIYKTKFNTYNPNKFIIKKNFSGNCFGNKKDIDSMSQSSNSYLLNNRRNPGSMLRDMAREMEATQNECIRNKNDGYNLLDKCRRRIFWTFAVTNKDHYGNSYKNFKPHWNPDLSVRHTPKEWFMRQKNIVKWILNRRHPNN